MNNPKKSGPKLNPYGEWYFGVGTEHTLPKLRYDAGPKEDFSWVAVISTFTAPIDIDVSQNAFQFLTLREGEGGKDQPRLVGALSLVIKAQEFISFLEEGGGGSETSEQAGSALIFDLLNSVKPDPFLVLPLPLRNDVVTDPDDVVHDAKYVEPNGITDPSITIVIDDGINFAHPRFRMADNTSRVDYAWVMDTPSIGAGSTVRYGREWTRNDIETAINEAGNDPEALLREIGYLDYTRNDFHSAAQNISHGTHVADLAAGMDLKSADVNRRIITVSLPSIATEDPSGITLGVFVLNAISYGLERARRILNELGKPNGAVAVNLSYAVSGGPHDGNGLFERIIEELLQYHSSQSGSTNTHVVVPAGNTFLNRTHSQFESDGPVNVEIPWRLPPGDGNSSFLEIWYPVTAKAVKITISSPTGQTWIFPSQCDLPQELNINGVPLGRLSQDIPLNLFPHERQRILLALCPTDGTLSGLPVVPHGIWEVSMKIKGSGDKIVDAWIQRDTAPFGYRPLGVQSYFDDPDYERFNDANGDWKEDDNQSPVRREGTISGIGTAPNVLTVGAYRRKPQDEAKVMSSYSSASSVHMRNPDCAFQGDTSRALPGILAASSRGQAAVLSGTSVAAPQLTRWIIEGGNPPFARNHYRYGEGMKDPPLDLSRAIDRDGQKTT